MKNIANKLRVCHYPQIPCKPFIQEVESEREAFLVEQVMALQHLFLFENEMIPDYSNAISVQMYEDGEWVDYWNENEVMDWDELRDTYF